ncbi:IucA/IucC family protein [Sutcliffiella halmapala]|uniref:IucA/IucC family protein n=1 Tax=Sutcliffiella halmapala TaxID=79882 RepID=UPI000995CA8F|nr:IucA/IucC family protein [Sutcliffiella halmapala]
MHLLSHCKTEERVKRQLVEAILFERLLPFELIEEKESTIFLIKGRTHTFQCKGRITAFDRYRIVERSILKINQDGTSQDVSLNHLIEELTTDGNIRSKVLLELQQTILLSKWNERNVPILSTRRDLPYEELESAITEGHPYHPCYKARTGFTLADHENYGPEANYSFQLCWIAIPRTTVRSSFPSNEIEFWKKELGEETYSILINRLKEQGGDFSIHTLFPVHPWQWKNFIQQHTLDLSILFLGCVGDSYRATQSVRTLWNETDLRKSHIKLAMNMVNTSSLRIFEPHSVCTAPEISTWLCRVQETDPFLQDRLVLLQEYAGSIVDTKSPTIQGQLAVIWRESVRAVLKQGEEAVPVNALSLMEQDGKPFIDDWLQKYGIEKWLVQFIEVAVLPVWHLLIAHGIGVEAHAQNMVLLHEDGWPTRLILRDFHESVEYTESFLSAPTLLPDFNSLHTDYLNAPNDKYYWMSSVEALRELVMDTLFVFHLSELSYLLEIHYHYLEERFWKQVQEILNKHLQAFPELVERHKLVQSDNSKIAVESLFTKKIKPGQSDYRHFIQNSLLIND